MPIRRDDGTLPLAVSYSPDVRDARFSFEIQCSVCHTFTKALNYDTFLTCISQILNAEGPNQSDIQVRINYATF